MRKNHKVRDSLIINEYESFYVHNTDHFELSSISIRYVTFMDLSKWYVHE